MTSQQFLDIAPYIIAFSFVGAVVLLAIYIICQSFKRYKSWRRRCRISITLHLHQGEDCNQLLKTIRNKSDERE